MRTAKISSVVKIYGLECPYCGADVANDDSGSLNFYDNESNGTEATCTNCLKRVQLPKALRTHEQNDSKIAAQRSWIRAHGGTLDGYRQAYAGRTGSDVEAIYQSDVDSLHALERAANQPLTYPVAFNSEIRFVTIPEES